MTCLGDVDVKVAALDDVEVVTCVALHNDADILCGDLAFLQRCEDLSGLLVVEV